MPEIYVNAIPLPMPAPTSASIIKQPLINAYPPADSHFSLAMLFQFQLLIPENAFPSTDTSRFVTQEQIKPCASNHFFTSPFATSNEPSPSCTCFLALWKP